MSDINAIANAFIEHYYTTYAQNRAGLAGLYTDSSYMSYEGTQVAGTENIMAKLNSLAFKTVQHKITSKDVQPTASNTLLIMVSGDLIVDDSANSMKFSQCFQLNANAEGGYYISNDIFRLNYG